MTVVKTHYRRSPAPVPAVRRRRAAELRGGRRGDRHDDRGEGVISAAIAVLIMAFLGVGMWVAFNATFQHTARNVNNQVNCIGRSTSSSSC